MKEYTIKVSRHIATYLVGREGSIIHDKNKPVVLIYSDGTSRKLRVRNLTLWEKIRLFFDPDYKQK